MTLLATFISKLHPNPSPSPSPNPNPNPNQVTLLAKPGAAERSNAFEDEVIAYEPPKPGEEVCEVCARGEDNGNMLLCDRCSCGFHTYCLSPPLTAVPAGEWFCALCLGEQFGFGSGQVMKYHQYEKQANAFKHAFFSSEAEGQGFKLSKKQKA